MTRASDLSRWSMAEIVVMAFIVIATATGIIVIVVGGGGDTFADDTNRACARHQGVFSFNAHQGGGVCRDGTAVVP